MLTFITKAGKLMTKGGKLLVKGSGPCYCDCTGTQDACAGYPATLYCHVTCDGTTTTFALPEQTPGGWAGRWWQGSGVISGGGTLIVCVACNSGGGELYLDYDACTGVINDCRDANVNPIGYAFPVSRTVMPPPSGCGCTSGLSFTVDTTP